MAKLFKWLVVWPIRASVAICLAVPAAILVALSRRPRRGWWLP